MVGGGVLFSCDICCFQICIFVSTKMIGASCEQNEAQLKCYRRERERERIGI
jgi:hypothetical protein